ncbi:MULTISPECIES: restriction endonuclease [Bacillaceae]|uniref:restriction endonuclease n=1 Tax=Bacillaceae TaxID=186817 RepID=UPI000694C128|nr:restriction endonuclease [Bacillus rubiinfantis]
MSQLIGWTVTVLVLSLAVPSLVRVIRTRQDEQRLRDAGIHDIDRMDENEFGAFIRLLFGEVGFKTTEVEELEVLFGADFILEGETKAVLQINRLGVNTRVGVRAVQEIVAARMYHGANEAWLITNTVFTENARLLAQVCNVKLIDRFLLQKLIVTVNPDANPKEVRESIKLLYEETVWGNVETKENREGKFTMVEGE